MRDCYRNTATRITLFVLLVCSSFVSRSATYYLSPGGSDTSGNGSSASPWFTLNKAWGVVRAGDIIYMRGGTYRYNSTQRLHSKSGSAGNLIKVWAAPGEKPVLTPSGSYADRRGVDIIGNYIHVKGLEITGYAQRTSTALYYGIVAENSNFLVLEQLSVHDNGFGLSIGSDSGDNLVLNSDFYRNCDPMSNFEGNIPWDAADGITIRSSNLSKTNTIRGCRMWWNSDDGVDLFKNQGTIIIENSWAFWNGFKPGGFTTAGNGNGFKLGITATDLTPYVKRILRHNLAFENRVNGVDQNDARCITHLYNNTTYNNGMMGPVARSLNFYNGTAATIAKNNLDFRCTYPPKFNTQASVTYNTFLKDGSLNPAYSVTSADFLSVSTQGVDGPRQSDGSLPNLNFLKLAPTSDLINKGTNVGLPYSGSAPDLGAFESGSTEDESKPADTSEPIVNSFAIPPTANTLEVPISTFTATDNVGVTGYLITRSSTEPSSTETGWTSAPPTSYKFTSVGTKTLHAWTKDAAGNVSSCVTDIVDVTMDQAGGLPTGVDENINEGFKIDVFPNPCVDNITVRFSEMPEKGSKIEIFDITGKTITSREVIDREERISLSQQSSGLYMVKTTIGTKETTTKLIVNK